MTDDRPRPQYGEYADIPPPTIDYPPPTLPEKPERSGYRTRDVFLTTALLLIGVWDVASRWQEYLALGPVFAAAYEVQGLGEFTSFELAETVGLWINVSRAIILVATIAVSLALIARRRLAFWVPLTGGALALLIVLVFSAYVLFADPAFAEFVERTTTGT